MTSVPPVSPRQHKMLDLVYGAALIATPFLLMSRRNRYSLAGLLPVVMGVGTLIQRNRTRYDQQSNDPSQAKLGLRNHLVGDSLAGLALAASPFVLGFARRSFVPHLILGLGEVGVALFTRYGRQGKPFGQAVADEANLGSNGSGRQPGNGSRQDQSGNDGGRSGHGQTYQNQFAGAGQDQGFASSGLTNENRLETWSSDISGNVGSQAEVISDDMGLHGTGSGTLSEGIPQSSQSDPAWNAAPMANVIVPPGQGDDESASLDRITASDLRDDESGDHDSSFAEFDRAAQNREITSEFEGRETVDDDANTSFNSQFTDDNPLRHDVTGDLGSGERDSTDATGVDSPTFGGGETPRRSRSRKGAGALARDTESRDTASDEETRPAHNRDEDVPGTL